MERDEHYHPTSCPDPFKEMRYWAQKQLGSTYSYTLWLACDTLSNKFVILRVHKTAQHYNTMAWKEIGVLVDIASKNGDAHVVKLLDFFTHNGPNGAHVCMVFELMGDNLLELGKHYDYKGIPLNMVKGICSSVLGGLDYLHRQHSIIHTGLSPENIVLPFTAEPTGYLSMSGVPILLPHTANSDLKCKIAGLSNACWTHKNLLSDIQSCGAYTCPEILLVSEFSTSADIWSLGCIVFQLVTGKLLFDRYDIAVDHLAQMIELLGAMPKEIACGGHRSARYFHSDGSLKANRVSQSRSLINEVREMYSEEDADEFCNFLLPLLDFAPHKRPTAAEALLHPWLNPGPRILQPSVRMQRRDNGAPEKKT
ncbi:hypothetical protein SUGI_0465990 [Cryptomeria japonica]|uniref:uncharacterized protein LOC131068382 n=1 Tax=Cryptomeria japonica TaxID=3369 RepID=UPI002408DDEC|nr:uncharacterized protein LOC131068382 [Cryptomeria japonica]GLJ24398.1 hypothetical protein SUGI_0465990 [Cryptomeria japonica]